jgi:Repeat of unknown function (DUF5648)
MVVTYTLVEVPGQPGSPVSGISNSGTIVGTNNSFNGFVYDGSTYTLIVGMDEPAGINTSGDIVGFNVITAPVHGNQPLGFSLFIHNGVRTDESDPNSGAGGGFGAGNPYTHATGINDNDQIVGFYDYQLSSGVDYVRGYVHTGSTFTDVVDPLAATKTIATGINNAGQIVGYFDAPNASGTSHNHGFIDTNGSFATIDVPTATDTTVTGINDRGDLVGNYTDSAGSSHGFYYTGGTFTTIDGPGGVAHPNVTGINNDGQIVGSGVVAGLVDGGVGFVTGPNPHLDTIQLSPVFRFFDTATNDHFYTLSVAEANNIRATLPTFHDEGSPWSTPTAGANTMDVYRFFDTATGDHFYTSSAAERAHIMATLPSYHYEGVAFEAYQTVGPGTLTLERFFNTISNVHHYSASAGETAAINAGAVGPGWVEEGPGFIVHT